MNLNPIDWGGPVQADQQGIEEARAVSREAGQGVAQATREIGGNISGASQTIAQGLLHSQALKATAAVKERQASTLQFIDSNPYVPKAVLQQRMSPDDYAQWEAAVGNSPEFKDKLAVPMYTVAGHLFDSEAKQARQDAGQLIGLPGWRGAWNDTEAAESSTIRERYVNRMAANQMVDDRRASDAMSIDTTIQKAVMPHDFDLAAQMAAGSGWLRPAEKKMLQEKALAAKDAFPVQEAIRSQDPALMKQQLDRLTDATGTEGATAKDFFPNSTPAQRLDLEQRLERVYGYHAAKRVAEQLVSPSITLSGRVDAAAIDKRVAEYNGPNKEEVVKAAQAQTQQAMRLWDDRTSQMKMALHTLGQDAATGEFSYAKMYAANPIAAEQLNKDDPDKLTSLKNLDTRIQRQQDIRDREAAQEAKQQQVVDSALNARKVDEYFDDPANADEVGSLTKAQFDSKLLDDAAFPGGWTKADREYARREFDSVQKRGGMPDPRITLSIKAEVNNAANGKAAVEKELMSKFGSALLSRAHSFVRSNAGLPQDQMVDALRKEMKKELLKGAVVGGGLWGDKNGIRRIEWEENPSYFGMDFKDAAGNVVPGVTPVQTPRIVARRRR